MFEDLASKAERNLTEAKKDNDFIYQERIPDIKAVDPIGKAQPAKVLQLAHPMSQNFKDLLNELVPVPVHQAFFDDKKEAKVSLRAHELNVLNEKEHADPNGVKSLWRPEYGAYMIEGTPGKPYGGLLAHFNIVEANMKHRREEVTQLLKPDETVMSLTSFPRLGCETFTDPPTKPTPNEGATKSLFFPDEAIFPGHPRFKTLSRNIRQRRGEKVAINLPIYKDKNTKIPVDDSYKYSKAALPDHVYMDAMGFGMGCCCLRSTFQACNISEARTLYDLLTPLCPIMLAFTAASPLHRGFMTDVDCRWNIISNSVHCRTEEERGFKPLQENKFVIKKSCYDSIDSCLSEQGEKYR